MEDVLEVYTRPYDPLRPQICMDEVSLSNFSEMPALLCRWSREEFSGETMSMSGAG